MKKIVCLGGLVLALLGCDSGSQYKSNEMKFELNESLFNGMKTVPESTATIFKLPAIATTLASSYIEKNPNYRAYKNLRNGVHSQQLENNAKTLNMPYDRLRTIQIKSYEDKHPGWKTYYNSKK